MFLRLLKRRLRTTVCLMIATLVVSVTCVTIIYYDDGLNRYYRSVLLNDRFSSSGISDNFDFVKHTLRPPVSSDQLSLWEKIVLPVEGAKKNFSFTRHGDRLDLYGRGNHKVPSDLVGNLSIYDVQMMLSPRPMSSVSFSVNCRRLISGQSIIPDGEKTLPKENENTRSSPVLSDKGQCPKYIKEQMYITSPITENEKDFPLAYSILIYTEVSQFQRLLRAIYRPQNIYCIHIDKKSSESFKAAINKITGCFQNVFVASKAVDVRWGTFSVLEPEFVCMEELLRRNKRWKYFINLTGQEFPIRTNYELVSILSAINGSNLVEGSVKRDNRERWKAAGPPPHNITPVKGGVHVVLNRAFVDFAVNNQVAKDFLNWCKKVEVPDELFFATLNNNPQLNFSGSYKGPPESNDNFNPYLTRFKNWEDDWPCHGKYVRGICIFGVGDLPLLATREELFANKFHEDFHPETLDCLEEMLINRTLEEITGTLVFNDSYYRTRDFVINKVQ